MLEKKKNVYTLLVGQLLGVIELDTRSLVLEFLDHSTRTRMIRYLQFGQIGAPNVSSLDKLPQTLIVESTAFVHADDLDRRVMFCEESKCVLPFPIFLDISFQLDALQFVTAPEYVA